MAPHEDSRAGLGYGFSAYLLWGLFPLFFPLLKPAGTIEILAQRMAWSLIVVVILLAVAGKGTFGHGAGHSTLLAGAGVVTAVPLLLFGAAATRVSLTTMGLLQYLTPTLQFLVGVVVRHEPLPADRLIGCCLIWAALIVFSVGGAQQRRKRLATEPRRDLRDALVGGR